MPVGRLRDDNGFWLKQREREREREREGEGERERERETTTNARTRVARVPRHADTRVTAWKFVDYGGENDNPRFVVKRGIGYSSREGRTGRGILISAPAAEKASASSLSHASRSTRQPFNAERRRRKRNDNRVVGRMTTKRGERNNVRRGNSAKRRVIKN